jgi:hypothetical protein
LSAAKVLPTIGQPSSPGRCASGFVRVTDVDPLVICTVMDHLEY